MTASKINQPAGSPFVRLRPFEVTAVLLLIWSVAVFVALAAFQQGRFTLVPVYAAFVLYLTVLSLPIVMPGHDSGIFQPVVFFTVCHGLMALLRTDVALASGVLKFHRAMPELDQAALDSTVGKLFVLKTLSLVGLYAGYSLMTYLPFRKLPEVRAKAFRFKAILLVGLSGMAVMVLASKAGGIGGLLMQRGLLASERIGAEIGQHWHLLASISTIVPVIWLAFNPAVLRTLLFWVITLSSLVFIFAARGTRSGVLIVLIVMGMVWTLRARRVPYKIVFAGLLVTVLLLGALGQFRRATQHEEDISDVDVETDVTTAFESGMEDLSKRGVHENGQIAVIGSVPSRTGYLYGRSYLTLPFVFLPSALVGPKPPSGGKLNALIIHERTETSIPAGPVGEAYWNFSYLGPLLVFFVYGAILKVIAGVYLQNHDNPVIVSLYVYVLFRFLPGSDPFFDFIHAVVPAVAFLLFVTFPYSRGRRVRRAPLAPQARLGGASVS